MDTPKTCPALQDMELRVSHLRHTLIRAREDISIAHSVYYIDEALALTAMPVKCSELPLKCSDPVLKCSEIPAPVCHHPHLYPTQWNQAKPEPCTMNTCQCGKNATCPVCGYGFGQYPCDCLRASWEGTEQFYDQ